MNESATAPRYRYLRFITVLACVYLAANLVPLLFHQSVAIGDNLIQNNPLRYLSAQILKTGELPGWNIFSWSGTPLLAGFNAGTFYPLSALYLILPPLVALGVFIAAVQLIFASGLFWLMDHLKVGEIPAAIFAAVAPFLGYFAAQTVHLDMVGGIAMVPFMLIAVIRLTRARTSRQSFGAGLGLGASYSLVILAGAPEAMIYEAAFVAVFTLLELLRSRTPLARVLPFAVAFVVSVLLLPAAQLLPGLEFVGLSQRGHLPATFATAGPLYPNAFMGLVTPFLFGGPGGNPAQPAYFGAFGFEEMQIFVGIVPLALAAYALIVVAFGSRRIKTQDATPLSSRRILQDLIFATIFSSVAALGSFTPLETLLLHVPIYDKQRLPARNIFSLEITVLVLAAFGFERFLATLKRSRTILVTLGVLGALAVVQTILLAAIGPSFTIWLGGTYHQINHLDEIIASSALEVAVIAAFAAVAFLRPRLTRRHAMLAVVALVGVDVVSFNYQSYYGSLATSSLATGKDPQQLYLASLLHSVGGRYAIYDPSVATSNADAAAGAPNLSLFDQMPSVMGYSSLTLGSYEAATASHHRTTMDPTLFYSNLGNQLELNVTVTSQGYFSTAQSSGSMVTLIPQPLAQTSPNPVTRQGESMAVSDYVGSTVTATRILVDFAVQSGSDVVDSPIIGIASIGALGVRLSGTKAVIWAHPAGRVITGSTNQVSVYAFDLPASTTFDQIVATQAVPANISNPQHAVVAGVSVIAPNLNLSLNGTLVGYLTPELWQYKSAQNSLLYFTRRTPSPLELRFATQAPSPPLPIGSHGGIAVRSASVTLAGKIHYELDARSPATLTISESYAPGWAAQVSSSAGVWDPSLRACGIFICLNVPRGISSVTLRYNPPRADIGLALSGIGVLWLVAATYLLFRRRLRVPRE